MFYNNRNDNHSSHIICNIISYNLHGFKNGRGGLVALCDDPNTLLVAVQEHWLRPDIFHRAALLANKLVHNQSSLLIFMMSLSHAHGPWYDPVVCCFWVRLSVVYVYRMADVDVERQVCTFQRQIALLSHRTLPTRIR